MIKSTTLILALSICLINSHSWSQTLVLEPEEQNALFVSHYKSVEVNDVFQINDTELLSIYNDITKSGIQKSIIFRKMSLDLSQIEHNEQTLPEDTYLRSIFQFRNGRIVALLYHIPKSKTAELFCAELDTDRSKIDLKSKVSLGVYDLHGRQIRKVIKQGNLFNVISERGSDYLAILNKESIKRSDFTEYGYTIIDENMTVHEQGAYSFDIPNKDIRISDFAISPNGNIYTAYRTFIEDDRAGDDTYVVQINSGKKLKLAKKKKALVEPSLISNQDGVYLFSSYAEDRKDYLKGRTQGFYIAKLNQQDLELEDENYIDYPEKLLSKLFLNKQRLVDKGNVSAGFRIHYLRESRDDQLVFLMERRWIEYQRDRYGNIINIIYGASSAIVGSIDITTSSLSWFDVINKQEVTRNFDGVGSFVYIDDSDHLNVLLNSTVEKDKRGVSFYLNKNLRNTSIVNLEFDHQGNRSENDLIEKSSKNIGFVFKGDKAFQNYDSRRVYLILEKKRQSKVRLATINF